MSDIIKLFQDAYGKKDIKVVQSPLRVCPLGAHVDHQGGVVTGMALDAHVELIYAPANDGYIHAHSADFPEEEHFHIDDVPEVSLGFWGNYLRGAVLSLKRNFSLTKGIYGVIDGKLPVGGLSSSAAVTTAYLMALCDVNDIEISQTDLVHYNHWVETEYIGLKNGILDQSANILSKNNHLLSMDCKTDEHHLIKKSDEMPEFEVVVVYSGVTEALIGTAYNNRVDECKVAGWIIQDLAGEEPVALQDIQLRDISVENYKQYRDHVPGRFKRRMDHYFTEQERVHKGMEAWKDGDIKRFGELMFESGESSVHQYESGCPELITIFEILRDCPGVYGARFSGAGYRGSCIGFIDPRYKGEIKAQIDAIYPKEHPTYKDKYNVHFCKTDDGASIKHITEGSYV